MSPSSSPCSLLVPTTRRDRSLAITLYLCVLALLLFLPLELAPAKGVRLFLAHNGLAEDPLPPPDEPPGLGGILVEVARGCTHAILFVPLPLLLASARRRPGVVRAAARRFPAAFLLALSTEGVQILVGRGASWDDLALDMVGYGLGLGLLWGLVRLPSWQRLGRALVSPLSSGALALGAAAAVGLALRGAPQLGVASSGLSSWDVTYPLLLGNSRTGARPWSGRIEHATFTDGKSVLLEYALRGAALTASPRGRVLEARGEGGPPLVPRPLGQSGEQGLVLATEEGVAFQDGGLLVSREAPEGWIRAVQRAGAFGIRLRLRPDPGSPLAPGRIVSSTSLNDPGRNFILSQIGTSLELRARGPISGRDGGRAPLRVEDCLVTGLPTDVELSLKDGALQLVVDGTLRGTQPLRILDATAQAAFGGPVTGRVLAALGLIALLLLAVLVHAGLGGRSLGPRSRWALAVGLGAALLAIAALAPGRPPLLPPLSRW